MDKKQFNRLMGNDASGEPAGEKEAAEPTSAQEQLDRLRADLEKANREGEEQFRQLQRVQADLINYRRRVEQERGDLIRGAKADLLQAILPALDDFERALRAIPPEQAGPWVEGVALIDRKLRNALDGQGVTQIDALGKEFDPWEHEAVVYQESADAEEGKVIGVLNPGYKLQGKVIRPAQVVVAKGGK